MTLGERLKSAREKKGWSQLYVAEKLGIANTVLSNYERDYRDPDTETLKRLAEMYEVSTDYLLGLDTSTKNRAFYGGGADLTDEERAAVEAFLAGYRQRKAEEKKQKDK